MILLGLSLVVCVFRKKQKRRNQMRIIQEGRILYNFLLITPYLLRYWTPNAGRLFKRYMLLVLINQMASALFRCIVALGRSLISIGQEVDCLKDVCSFALLILFALCGSVLSRDKDYKFEIYLSQNLKQDLYPL
ncbi:hypothetical protein DCAR_0626549 [Daucus carota subsp. sativus]|uniref:Uncharacterized protein n=1 Tax=Daucus carota subsp. sativus TaxID=79200 RepID=A0A161WVQ3_DAUCS|nr:hypothetical protein DCAR_0626549 [Daucus carota subsp. sativus]